MDRGKIVEIGNHDELMAREGHYWRLYMAQSKQLDAPPALGAEDDERIREHRPESEAKA
jgi:ATP-binding cassette subfamily B protein